MQGVMVLVVAFWHVKTTDHKFCIYFFVFLIRTTYLAQENLFASTTLPWVAFRNSVCIEKTQENVQRINKVKLIL
jgi:hypothetical protein